MNPVRELYYKSKVLGLFKKIFIYWPLQKIYGFNSWHMIPICQKHYAIEIISKTEEIMRENNFPVVEIGCGRGDIIGNIRYNQKFGIDLSPEVLKVARLFHHDTEFIAGGFDKIEFGEISCLIMVNFIHGISPSEMRENMKSIFAKNNVKFVCFDVITDKERSEYKYTHSGREMLGEDYESFYVGRKYRAANFASRHIEFWRKKE